ncbi:MAG: heme-binding protein [Gemmatimonadales bacterium]
MRCFLLLLTGLAIGPGLAHAQLAERPVLTLEAVKAMMNAAEAEAARNNWNVSIAIVDAHGDLLAFRRLDGAHLGSIDIAQGKARTAARLRRPTRALAEGLAAGNLAFLSVDGITALQGGLPIDVGGTVIGAVGVSGVTSAQDEQIAAAGIAALRR